MQLDFEYPDDLVRGATKYLLSFPDITNLVGQFPGGTPYIFEEKPLVTMQGVSKQWPGNAVTAIVLTTSGTWASPDPQSTGQFPKLGVEIWADPPRDADGMVTKPSEARVAADYLYKVVDFHLNRTSSDLVFYGTVPIFRSVRIGDITYLPKIPSDDHLVLGNVYYAISTTSYTS